MIKNGHELPGEKRVPHHGTADHFVQVREAAPDNWKLHCRVDSLKSMGQK